MNIYARVCVMQLMKTKEKSNSFKALFKFLKKNLNYLNSLIKNLNAKSFLKIECTICYRHPNEMKRW